MGWNYSFISTMNKQISQMELDKNIFESENWINTVLRLAGEWTICMNVDLELLFIAILNLRKLWFPTSIFYDEPPWSVSFCFHSVTSYRILFSILTKITEIFCGMILDTWKLQILELASFLKLQKVLKKRGLCPVTIVPVSMPDVWPTCHKRFFIVYYMVEIPIWILWHKTFTYL